MSVHDLGIEVVCDGCERESIVYSEGANWREGEIERQLEKDDWRVVDGYHFCSTDCAERGLAWRI